MLPHLMWRFHLIYLPAMGAYHETVSRNSLPRPLQSSCSEAVFSGSFPYLSDSQGRSKIPVLRILAF
jgi:hypothetical protein